MCTYYPKRIFCIFKVQRSYVSFIFPVGVARRKRPLVFRVLPTKTFAAHCPPYHYKGTTAPCAKAASPFLPGGAKLFLDLCCFSSRQGCIKGTFFLLCSIPENIFQEMYHPFSRFFSSHATFSHVRACFFTYLHHICMLVASA